MVNVFIIGSKGIPAAYGGFETFVEKLTEKRKCTDIQYHVSCLGSDSKEFEHNGARCFDVSVPCFLRGSRAIFYDILALRKVITYIKKNKIQKPIVYVLACRIGPVIGHYKKKIKKLGGTLLVNPDGHEWERGKWNRWVRFYWKLSTRLMVKHAELLVCDSKNIENDIQRRYAYYKPNATFIAYGADIQKSQMSSKDDKVQTWYKQHGLFPKEYYLIVGRFVPENNLETIIIEFMKSKTHKSLVIISNVERCAFYSALKQRCGFEKDSRIKFVGTVYDQELLKKIREDAYGYFHGHEVGGTNPSLLEALASTDLNLLLDVGFNKEVAEDSALYWNKKPNNLSLLIDYSELLDSVKIEKYAKASTQRIQDAYSWDKIVGEYEELFYGNLNVAV